MNIITSWLITGAILVGQCSDGGELKRICTVSSGWSINHALEKTTSDRLVETSSRDWMSNSKNKRLLSRLAGHFLARIFCTLMNFHPVHGQPLNAVHFHKILFLITHMSTKRFQGATNNSSNNRENLLLSLLSPKTLLIVPAVYWPNSTRLIQLICCRCCAGLASSMKLSLRQWWFIQWSATHLTALYVLPSSVQFMLSSSISPLRISLPLKDTKDLF